MLTWRVELHRRHGLHANPDERLHGLDHHLSASDVSLAIADFNVLVAVHVAAGYLGGKPYPLGPEGGRAYNPAIKKLWRRITP